MPELPEVHTTVTGLHSVLPGLSIIDVWTDYDSPFFYGTGQIKDPAYFSIFKKSVVGTQIVSVTRRAKNILIHLSSGSTMLVHMKMTGHLMYGTYRKSNTKEKRDTGETWLPAKKSPLSDPFNRFVHFVCVLSNGKHLVLSDVRKFAKVTLLLGDHALHPDIQALGKEPLSHIMTGGDLKKALGKKPNAKMKQAIMDQTLIAGIGNIYSDEILWRSSVHPLRTVSSIQKNEWKRLCEHMHTILQDSISKGGDSLSDYRNAFGEKGAYQNHHQAYRNTGKPCQYKACTGTIQRMVIGGRSSHFCPMHQK